MKVSTLERGIISESDLLRLFATEKQRAKYESSGNKFTGLNKTTVLKQASLKCEIKDIGGRKYEISKVFEYPEPKTYGKMHRGIHQWLIPLTLISLVKAKIYEVESISFTCAKWHRMINMTNRNYIPMRYHVDYTSRKFGLRKEVVYDFFNHADSSLTYFFKKSLEYLKTAMLFDYREANWVCVRKRSEVSNGLGVQKITIDTEHRLAEPEELQFIRTCEQMACHYAGIPFDENPEKFYGTKSKAFQSKLRELLLERNISYHYKAYEIFTTDKDVQRCYHLLKSFKDAANEEHLILNLAKSFQKHLLTNLKKRLAKKVQQGSLTSSAALRFTREYKKIMKMTLEYDASDVEVPNVLDESSEEDINKIISDNIHISFNGKTVNIGVDSENN